jgi:EAL and modified HD-GYP domain-containing signal transduction protein
VAAYRLCDRSAEKLFGTMNDYQEMGEYLMSPGLNLVEKVGVEPFAGDRQLFVDLNQYLLLVGVPTNMKIPPECLVCILPGTIPQDELILARCNRLLACGYTLAIDGFPLQYPACPLMDLVRYVILDFASPTYNKQMKAMLPHLSTKKVIISNVPDQDAYNKLLAMPNALFSGSFYSQPITRGAGAISPLKINALQMLNLVNQDDVDFTEATKILERDPSISIALMRFINSPTVGVRRKISSIKNAVAILGQKELKRWVTIAVSVTIAQDRPSEIIKLSLVRAKFAENLSNAYELGMFASSLFMAGLFSLLDVILQKPMPEAIKEISVDERVSQALVDGSGPLYDVLDMIYAYERANWDKVSINMLRNNVTPDAISTAFIDALVWYKQLLKSIDEEGEESVPGAVSGDTPDPDSSLDGPALRPAPALGTASLANSYDTADASPYA